MTARSTAIALGGDIVGRTKILAPGPGHSPADRSMSVLISPGAPDGFVVSSFAGDDWRLCRDHVRHVLGLAREFEHRDKSHSWRPEHVPGHDAPPANSRHTEFAARLWQEAIPINGTLAAIYLAHRDLGLPAEILDGHAVRFHGACPYRLEDGRMAKLPTMLAAMVDIRTNALRGVHRTALATDGFGKSVVPGLGNPKKMLGTAAGACVKLSPDDHVTLGLHIAEGIETTLACMDMGFRPIWAALSAGSIASFPTLAGVEELTVFADHDANGAGLNAARRCAARWSQAAHQVTIAFPASPGHDWADDVRGMS
jgi:hypothetical protein